MYFKWQKLVNFAPDVDVCHQPQPSPEPSPQPEPEPSPGAERQEPSARSRAPGAERQEPSPQPEPEPEPSPQHQPELEPQPKTSIQKSTNELIKEITKTYEENLQKVKSEYDQLLKERDEIIKAYICNTPPQEFLTVAQRINANRKLIKW